METMVSVIIPVYNAEKTLKKCLDSVKKQTFEAWRVILVDDASGDDSIKIIEEYIKGDDRFSCIKLNKNGGAANARNIAMKQVETKYTAFLDSDDYWSPYMLQKLIEISEQFECDVVQCRFIYDFANGKHVLPKGALPKSMLLEGRTLKKVYMKMMTGINMNHVCMKLIRTSLIKDMEFDTSLPTAEDLEFCVRLFRRVKKYFYTDEVMYHYLRTDTSITGMGLSFYKRLSANQKVSKEMIKALPAWNMDSIFYRMLCILRPYIIICSKVFRIIREKTVK